ncbi:MAG: recombinase family protein [Phycisphaerae bacterium]
MQAAIGYVRVSTEEQGVSGLGLADQRARIEAYCTLRGLRLAATIEDVGVSGGKVLASRPGGGRLLRCLQERRAGHVVMLKLDRGFRNAADCLATVEAWQRRQVTLHVIDLGGNAIDTASAAGKFMLTVLAGAAEMERNLTRERTRAAMQVKRSRGERISRYAPFGWRLAGTGRLIPDLSEQRAVTLVRRLHAEGKSLRRIADELQARGIVGRSGGPIPAKTVYAVLRRIDLP